MFVMDEETIRLARIIRRPNSFLPPPDLPEDDLSSSGSKRSDVSRPEEDLPGKGSTRPDHVTGGSNEATFLAMKESPLAPEVPVAATGRCRGVRGRGTDAVDEPAGRKWDGRHRVRRGMRTTLRART